MKTTVAFLLALASLPLFGQESGAQKEKGLIQAAGSPRVYKDEEQFLIEGFALVPGGTEVDTVPRQHGVNILLGKGDFEPLARQLEEFINSPLTEGLIAQVKAAIVEYFRKERSEYVAAIIPVQQVTNAVLVLQILEGHVGKIEYKGQKWISERVVRKGLGIEPGDPIIETEFLNDVTFFNRNPFRYTQMILVPGKEKGVTDLTFMTKDRFPARFFTGSDNTGFISNGTFRLYAGFNWGDALLIGDLFSYQYTASTNFHSFQSHTFNYTSFLPWKNLLSIYGCYGQVFPNIKDFDTKGVNIQASGRYVIPFRPFYGIFRHNIEVGFDWKYFTSNLFFVGDAEEATPVSNDILAVTEFLLSYSLQRNWTQHLLSFRIDMYLSPWKSWFPHQTSSDYEALRTDSHVRYAYWKGSLGDVYRTDEEVTISWLLRGQVATGTLPTSEQFGLGGHNTVRGYYDQQFVADCAFCGNLEVYSPKFPLFKGARNDLAFLVFFDYGYGYNYTAVSPEFVEQNLIGIGPGLRYDIVPYFRVKMDYGFQVLRIPNDNRTGRFHYSVDASY
jgi:hemolysin activation/secretion protein